MNRSTVRRFTIVSVCCLAVLMVATLAHACPGCKDALGNDPARAAMVRGYFWSILFMMSMPFLILGGMGTYFYLQIRKARRNGWPLDRDASSGRFAEQPVKA